MIYLFFGVWDAKAEGQVHVQMHVALSQWQCLCFSFCAIIAVTILH